MTSPGPDTEAADAPSTADPLTTADDLLAAGDVAGVIRHPRVHRGALLLPDFVRVLRDCATSTPLSRSR